MIIDSHIHVDLYKVPEVLIENIQENNIIAVLMTNLPSYYQQAKKHLLGKKKIRLSLGYHPLFIHDRPDEFFIFKSFCEETSFIGEVGLDFSKEGISSKVQQIKMFDKILDCINERTRYISIHSRKAEEYVYEMLVDKRIKSAVFHWYNGNLSTLDKIVNEGYYFSINPAMIQSKKGLEIIQRLPKDQVLTETDGPFIMIKNKTVEPKNIGIIIEHLHGVWNISYNQVSHIIENNFLRIMNEIKKDQNEDKDRY
jgi:TatD DNase family protein